MRGRFPIFVVLAAIVMIVGIFVYQDPEQAQRLIDMRRNVAFQGETRDIAMGAVTLLIGGFVVYLLVTRR